MLMGTNEKTTALIPSVGADGGQPFSNSTKYSIPENGHKINPLKGNLGRNVYKTPLLAAERGGVPHYA